METAIVYIKFLLYAAIQATCLFLVVYAFYICLNLLIDYLIARLNKTEAERRRLAQLEVARMSQTNEVRNGGELLFTVFVDGGGAAITSLLEREVCPSCNEDNCCHSCGGSQGADDSSEEDEVAGRLMYNGFLDGVESLTLALAQAGYDVTSAKYGEAVQTALDAAGNNY